jgi:L-alanine-DL-glutamate epimerase-like enolase superfamily enzyme
VYRHTPLLRDDGTVEVPDVPGIGAEPDEEALAPYRTGVTVIDASGTAAD